MLFLKKRLRKALVSGAFFVFAAWLNPTQALPPSCQNLNVQGESATVEFVFDGDTVRLSDDTRVRLIGLDTPEIFWRNADRDPEPYAIEAREVLIQLVEDHDAVFVFVDDVRPEDRFGRRLAHMFTSDGVPVAALLMAEGLATRMIFPPNHLFADCYRDAENQARAANLRLWSLDETQPIPSTQLSEDMRGYQFITGRVTRIGFGRRSVWINLEGRAALRVDHGDLGYFDGIDFEELVGERVEARGFMYVSRGENRINLRHPIDLVVLESQP